MNWKKELTTSLRVGLALLSSHSLRLALAPLRALRLGLAKAPLALSQSASLRASPQEQLVFAGTTGTRLDLMTEDWKQINDLKAVAASGFGCQ